MKKSIKVPILARVEGEGALDLEIKKNVIEKLHLKIYESPRLFEQFLVGREPNEVVDMVARICGICPVAYQMSAVHALENIFQVEVTPWIKAMRRVYYCGEWMESHSLHIHLLALPDFLGFNSGIEMAKVYPEEVKRGLRLQAVGNKLIKLLGARSVHPVGACVGGFYKAPEKQDVQSLLKDLNQAKQDASELITWLSTLSLPSAAQDFIHVALRHEHDYPLCEGNIVTSHGLSLAAENFPQYFKEEQVSYSTALHCRLQGETYLVGPLARLNLNFDKLPQEILTLLKSIKFELPSKNMFHSVIARAIEVYYAILEASRILESYTVPQQANIAFNPIAGEGFAATEAPRGLLWHHYKVDKQGLISYSRIVPPTSQNQARIEEDLKWSLENFGLAHSEADLRLHAEQVIRNYDPCISCSTHFLNLKVTR